MTQNNGKQYRIAVTGGIGSGKSTVARMIAEMKGYPLFSADAIYADLLDDADFLNGLENLFGESITAGGRLDRARLAKIVFNDPERLKVLNGYTHPAIMNEMRLRMQNTGARVAVGEVPLLFEGNFQHLFDEVVVVMRKKEDRILAVINRDGISEQSVVSRMKNQFDYDNLDESAYTIIRNDGTLEDLQCQIASVLQDFPSEV